MKSKTIFSLLLIGSIFFMPKNVEAKECFLINNNDICISSKAYSNLISMGFNDIEIKNLDLDEYNANKDLVGNKITTVTKYYKNTTSYIGKDTHTMVKEVSEEEYNNISEDSSKILLRSMGSVIDGITETTGKRMDTTIIETNGKLRYKVTVTWKKIPKVRSYDIIGIGLDHEYVYASGNRTFRQTYCVSPATCQSSTTAAIKNQETGVGASFKLPTGSYVYMSAYLYYDVSKSVGVGTVTSLHAYGDYAHATENVNSWEAEHYYAVGYNGLNLYSDISFKYDAIGSANAHWMGSW